MTIGDGQMLWTHSGDSHFIEPPDLWGQILPPDLAQRMPWSERVGENEEVLHVDGKEYRRTLPRFATKAVGGMTLGDLSSRPPGTRDLKARLSDLDHEGVWAEVVYSSLGLWDSMISDRRLALAAAKAENEWKAAEAQAIAPDRLVLAATMPLRDPGDAVQAALHAKEVGLHVVALPTPGIPNSTTYDHSVPAFNSDAWEPLWAALEETGLVAAFHVGGDAGEIAMYRGPGGAVLNYTSSTYSGQRAAMLMVASGALDRHPGLRVLVSDGGASWVPFLGDRMEEAYRQHGMFVRPRLSRPPREILYTQVYTSFQHEPSALVAINGGGYRNVLFGSDYPHIEGTFGHTQETLHELLDGQTPEVSYRIRQGAFKELFPHVSDPPAA